MYRPLPVTGFAALLRKECGSHCRLTAHSVSRLQPQSSPTPSIFSRGSCLPTTKNRCGRRHKDYRAPFHYGNKLFILAAPTLYPDTAPSSRCRARLHIGMSGNLRLLFFLRNATKALKRLPSRRCRSASLPSPFHAVHFRLHSA